MSSTTVLSPPPFLTQDGRHYQLLSCISRSSENKSYLHFPYPYIEDSAFVRPSGGYRIDAAENDNYATAIYRFQSDFDGIFLPYIYRMRASGFVNNWHNFLGNYTTSSPRYFLCPSSSNCVSRENFCGPITSPTVIQGTDRRYVDADLNNLASDGITGTRLRFNVNSNQITKCHATFYYYYMTEAYNNPETVDANTAVNAFFGRYRPNPSASLQNAGTFLASTNIINKIIIDPEDGVRRRHTVKRIAWDTRCVINPSIGYCEIELPWLEISVSSSTYVEMSLRICDIHGVIIFSKQ